MEKFLIESGTLKTYITANARLTLEDYGKAIIKKKPKRLGELILVRRLSDGQEWWVSSEAVCRKIGRWKQKRANAELSGDGTKTRRKRW